MLPPHIMFLTDNKKCMLKTFVKILIITVLMQSLTLAITVTVDKAMATYDKSSVVSVVLMLAGIMISTPIGIILPIKWCNTKQAKLLVILLLPTNYTWLILLLIFVKMLSVIYDIINNIPPNFG